MNKIKSHRKPNKGMFEVGYDKTKEIELELNDFYMKDGFVILERSNGDIEHLPSDRVTYIRKRNKTENA